MGKYAEAVTEFDKALAIRPNDPEVLLKRGTTLAGLGRLDEAAAALSVSPQIREQDVVAAGERAQPHV